MNSDVLRAEMYSLGGGCDPWIGPQYCIDEEPSTVQMSAWQDRRTSVITPQSHVVAVIVPKSDKSNRHKGCGTECVAPYTDDDSAYRVQTGEIFMHRTNDFESVVRDNNGMPSVRGFTSMNGIRFDELQFIRPLGVATNPGAGAGVDQTKDCEAGVVLIHGTSTIWNTGKKPIWAGDLVWINPIPAQTGGPDEATRKRYIECNFYSENKWLPQTCSYKTDNVMATISAIDRMSKDMFGRNGSLKKTITQESVVNIRAKVSNELELNFGINSFFPTWNYAHLKCSLDIMDQWGRDNKEKIGTADLPPSIYQYCVEAYNMCLERVKHQKMDFAKATGQEVPEQPLIDPDQFEKTTYAVFNCDFRSMMQSMMHKLQTDQTDMISKLILGRAITGAKPGQLFDILVGVGHP